jgi:hypothetical protein
MGVEDSREGVAEEGVFMEEAVVAGMAARYVFVFNDRECGCWHRDVHFEDGVVWRKLLR